MRTVDWFFDTASKLVALVVLANVGSRASCRVGMRLTQTGIDITAVDGTGIAVVALFLFQNTAICRRVARFPERTWVLVRAVFVGQTTIVDWFSSARIGVQIAKVVCATIEIVTVVVCETALAKWRAYVNTLAGFLVACIRCARIGVPAVTRRVCALHFVSLKLELGSRRAVVVGAWVSVVTGQLFGRDAFALVANVARQTKVVGLFADDRLV